MSDLLSERVIPEAAIARPPTPEQHAREMLKLSPDWRVFSWRAIGDPGKSVGILITGAVCTETIQRGPWKGTPNWKKRDRATEIPVTVFDVQHQSWLAAWERDTGLCHGCQGSGSVFASWSTTEGTKYRPCARCNATGKAQP